MNTGKSWDEISETGDEDLAALLQASRITKLSSRSPLQQIKRNLLINMIWGIIICCLYVWVILYFNIWQARICLFMVLVFSLWALYTAFLQYQKLNASVSSDVSLLTEMKRNYRSIADWINTQQRIALLIYPVSAAGGFMLGGVLGSGKPVETFMHKPFFIIALLIAIVILVPACYYLARWMFAYSFGKHLNALKANIKALEEENNNATL